MKNISRRSFTLASLGLVAAAPALSAELGSAPERPILVVGGRVSTHNDGDLAKFDRSMLEALGMRSFRTKTPWYSEPVVFEGIPMRTLLREVGASGTRVTATALNDYTTDIPLADFDQFNVLLALKRDGNYMPVRDKGPLFIVYPYDTDARLQSQTYYGRSAWQVCKLVVS
jgi:hypothetical protein